MKQRWTAPKVTNLNLENYPGEPPQAILGELRALRQRLESAPDWFRSGSASIKIFALSGEIERLAHRASRTDDSLERARLVADAREHIAEMQRLLGTH